MTGVFNHRIASGLFAILVFFSMPERLVAQVFPLPEQNPEWVISTNGLERPSEERFTLTGEFLSVQGEEWPMIQHTSITDWEFFIDTTVSRAGAYFVDGDKVYFKEPIFGYEGLLYDFSAEVGDTFFIVSPGTVAKDSIEVTVTDREVESCDDGRMMRTIYLRITDQEAQGYELVWREGLGEVDYPFISRQCLQPDCDVYYEGNVLILGRDTIVVAEENGCLTSDEHLWEDDSPIFNIYPNPNQSQSVKFTLNKPSFNGAIIDVHITDRLGRLVKQWEGPIREGVVESVDIQGLKPGYYFIILKHGNSSPLTRKFIVID